MSISSQRINNALAITDIAIVLPVYNEEENLNEVFDKISKTLKSLSYSYEIIFIDDGSTDNSFDKLINISTDHPEVKIVRFRKNFGQTAAMAAGIDVCNSNIIVFMDSDLQNDPNDIPLLLKKIEEGYDVVSGWRRYRNDPMSKKIPSKLANKIIRKISNIKIHDLGCSLKAYRSEILSEIKIYGEMHRFLPIIAASMGAKITEIEVQHHPRKHGVSKYGLGRTFKVLLDLATVQFFGNYGTKPIYIYGFFAMICFLLSFASGTSVLLMKIFWHTDMTGNPFLLLTVLFILITIILMLMGIQAEVMTRIYHQSDNIKQYHIKQTCNL